MQGTIALELHERVSMRMIKLFIYNEKELEGHRYRAYLDRFLYYTLRAKQVCQPPRQDVHEMYGVKLLSPNSRQQTTSRISKT